MKKKMRHIKNMNNFINEGIWNPIKNYKDKKQRQQEQRRIDGENIRAREIRLEEERIRNILDNQPEIIHDLLNYIENNNDCISNAKKTTGPFYESDDYTAILSNGLKIYLYDDGDYCGIKINDGEYINLVWQQHSKIKQRITNFITNTWGNEDEDED